MQNEGDRARDRHRDTERETETEIERERERDRESERVRERERKKGERERGERERPASCRESEQLVAVPVYPRALRMRSRCLQPSSLGWTRTLHSIDQYKCYQTGGWPAAIDSDVQCKAKTSRSA